MSYNRVMVNVSMGYHTGHDEIERWKQKLLAVASERDRLAQHREQLIEELAEARSSPQAGMREALEIIAAPLGNPPDVQDGDTAAAEVTHWWQQLAIRYRKAARAALSTAPIPMSEDAK